MQPQKVAIASEVRAMLARKQLRQADLATALDITRPAMSRRLAGLTAFSVEELDGTAAFLEVPLEELLRPALAEERVS